jgi:hypothetical protein
VQASALVVKAESVKEMTKSEKWVSGPWNKGLVEVAVFGAGGRSKTVNSFLKYFCAQELWSRVVAFACLRVRADGALGTPIGREKKAL